MRRRDLARTAGGGVLAVVAGGAEAAQPARAQHRIVLHVGGGDPGLMRTALNNIANAQEAYAAAGQSVQIELVANGPGYAMLRADTTPVAARLAEIHARYPAVVFSACQASRKLLATTEGKPIDAIPQVPEATDVPAGIVRITQLQEEGWAYIRV